VPVGSHPEAVARIVEEGRRRIKKRVEIEKGVLKQMPTAHDHAGQRLELEPLQVVGKKCAASGRTISYEPDARVCALCERVYFKRSVPNKCKCGNDISAMRPATIAEPEDLDEDFYDQVDEEEDEVLDDEESSDDESTDDDDQVEAKDDEHDEEDEKGSSKKVKASEDAES
jgi:hypothetical protein